MFYFLATLLVLDSIVNKHEENCNSPALWPPFFFSVDTSIIQSSMYKPTSKRKKRAQLAFIYTLMSISIIAIVAILVLIMLGYRFNRFDGRVEQGGLVQFDSRPSGATVNVDGTTLANKTASKITLTTGRHTVTMSKDGYNDWKKDINVEAGSVLWLNYTLMLPKQLATSTTADLPAASSVLTSPDRKYIAMIAAPTDPTVTVLPLDDDKPQSSKVSIDPSILAPLEADKSQSFGLIAWDKDNRHGLVKRTYNEGKTEYLWIDLRGQDAGRNITMGLGVDIASVEFSLDDSNILYVLTTSHELRRINIANNTLSGPLVANVASFTQADRSTVTFATLPDQAQRRSVGYLTNGSSVPRIMRSTTEPESVAFSMYIAKYYGDQFMVFLNGQTVEIMMGDIPTSASNALPSLRQVAKYNTKSPVSSLDFSPYDKRFVAAEYAGGVAVYDLELDKLSTASFPTAQTRKLDWLGTYQFATTAGGVATYYDFDGTNGQTVASNALDMPVALSENGKYFYHFAAGEGSSVKLIRTKMTTD